MTDQEIALKWLASGTWKQDVETAMALSIIVSTLRDYGAIKAERDAAIEDLDMITNVLNCDYTCKNKTKDCMNGGKCAGYEWRGVVEE